MSRKDRKQRLENRQSGSSISFSADLLIAARLMLEYAMEDRKENLDPPQNNHQSKHSIGSILLLMAGFESWLNEVIAYLSSYDRALCKIGSESISVKYEKLCRWIMQFSDHAIVEDQGTGFEDINGNLKIVVEVRNEIAHAMPLPTGQPGDVPSKLRILHDMGLLITTGKPEADYTFYQKLRSYALAYWCWRIVEGAVNFLVNFEDQDQVIGWTAQNFSSYKDICPPEDLTKYDSGEWVLRVKKIEDI